MSRFDRKDTQSMLMCVACLAVFPLSIALTRPRPLAANSTADMTLLVAQKRQEQVWDAMRSRYEAVSLSDAPDASNDPKVRWRTLGDGMERSGAEPSAATTVTAAAAKQVGDAWPCLIEPGYFQGRPVWIVAASTPTGTGSYGFFCGSTTAEERLRAKRQRFCSRVQVVIFDAETPYQKVG